MRKILSFARRVGKSLSLYQKDIIVDFLPQVNMNTSLVVKDDIVYLNNNQNNLTKVIFEIGFGNGLHLAKRALNNQDDLFIGCEPFLNGVAALLKEIKEHEISNIYIWNNDANILLNKIPDNFLQEVHIFFPDPWPKKKHHKRRIINHNSLKILSQKLKHNGEIKIATDHAEYAKYILMALINSDCFKTYASDISEWQTFPDDWIKTKYQLRAEEQGYKCFYFNFINCK
jgi:tRNA (guanine-N7-)-methyltransferase